MRKEPFFFLTVFMLSMYSVFGQWTMHGPEGCSVNCLYKSGNDVYAGTSRGISKSTNDGQSWTPILSGYNYITQIVKVNSTLYAASPGSSILYRSSDEGQSWEQLTSPGYTTSLLDVNGTLFMSAYEGVFFSVDQGTTWTQTDSGMDPTYGYYTAGLYFHQSSGLLYAGLTSGLHVSSDLGITWTLLPDSPIGVSSMVIDNNTIITAGIYSCDISSNNGATWQPISDLPFAGLGALKFGSTYYMYTVFGLYKSNDGQTWVSNPIPNSSSYVFSAVTSNNDMLIGGPTGMFRQNINALNTWLPANTGLYQNITQNIIVHNNEIYTSSGGGVYKSSDEGQTWISKYSNLGTAFTVKLLSYNNMLYATTNRGIFRSSDHGDSWQAINNGLVDYTYYNDIKVVNNVLYTCNSSGIYKSADNGNTWVTANGNLTSVYGMNLSNLGTDLYVGTFGAGMYKSTDNGTTWIPMNNGLDEQHVLAIGIHNNTIYAVTSNGTFYSNDHAASWTKMIGLSASDEIIIYNNEVYVTGNRGIYKISAGNSCYEFFPIDLGNYLLRTYSLLFHNNKVYTGGYDYTTEGVSGVYVNSITSLVSNRPVTSAISGSTTICSSSQNYMYSVTNTSGNTYTWTVPSGATIVSGQGTNIISVDFAGFAVGTSAGISVVESNGCTGQPVSLTVSKVSPPPASTITGPSSVCTSQSGVLYSIANISGATYVWSVPGDAAITSGSGTPSITTTFGAQGGIVSVAVTSACGTENVSLPVTVAGTYAVGNTETNCGAATSFCIPITATTAISNGVIGLDLVLNYDATVLTPTGTATLGSLTTAYAGYSLNKTTPGKVYLTIFLDNAPANTYINGTGIVACVNFNLTAGALPGTSFVSTESIVESFPLSSQTVCNASAGTFKYVRTMKGQLYYRNSTASTKRITGVTGNTTSSFLKTNASCVAQGAPVSNLNNVGQFTIDVAGVSGLKIERDILGDVSVPTLNCANVQSVISSTDRNMAAQISNLSIASPTLYELIAADVNLDGKVTAGDATLISQRSINAYHCEFPQGWNYTWDGTNLVPSSNYSKSKDWVFIDQATLNNPSFTAGMNKDNVPHAPECLGVSVISPTCTTAVDVVYQGILLGDVNGNWASSNSANLKTGASEHEIIFNLAQSVSLGNNLYKVPVSYSTGQVFFGIDMEIDYNNIDVQIEAVSKNANLNGLGLDWNDIQATKLMLTSYTEQGIATSEPVLYLQVKTSGEKPKASDLGTITAYVNEELAHAKIVDDAAAVADAEFSVVSVYPNPASDVLKIQGIDIEYKTKIYNLLGNEVFSSESALKEINISNLASGVYYIKLISGDSEKLIRFTKIK